ncbi:Na-translocating system protein MpsC family protein [Bacillus infantis]|uniref:Na-translocating system protein MpsC family protein n=1 Tax=Bacillus infantis TaxID=324767 RepID=UPI003CEE97F4
MDIKKKEKELGSFIGRLLRGAFGKGPGAVFATISPPYITVYMRDFMSQIEDRLLDTEQSKYVEKIRDMLMPALIEEIKVYIQMDIGVTIDEFYYDWNLESHSGMFVGISTEAAPEYSPYQNQEAVHKEVIQVSLEAEKAPGEVHSSLLNPRTLVIIRNEILVAVEKELIRQGYPEVLTLAKRDLEKRLFMEHRPQFERYLDAELENVFASWDFEKDKSVCLFILKPNNSRQQ